MSHATRIGSAVPIAATSGFHAAHARGQSVLWWLSGLATALAILAEAILAGRLVVQIMFLQGAIAHAVYTAGGILQAPITGAPSNASWTHGVFESETLTAMVFYSTIGFGVPLFAIILSSVFSRSLSRAATSLANTATRGLGLLGEGVSLVASNSAMVLALIYRQAAIPSAYLAKVLALAWRLYVFPGLRVAVAWTLTTLKRETASLAAYLRSVVVLAWRLYVFPGLRLAVTWTLTVLQRQAVFLVAYSRHVLVLAWTRYVLPGFRFAGARSREMALRQSQRLKDWWWSSGLPTMRWLSRRAQEHVAAEHAAWFSRIQHSAERAAHTLRRLTASFAARR